jgi:hypothetical protein
MHVKRKLRKVEGHIWREVEQQRQSCYAVVKGRDETGIEILRSFYQKELETDA